MTAPPRSKPCPSCGGVCALAATACPACGFPMPRRATRRAPDAQDRLAAALAWQAWQPGQPIPPIVGKRRCARPDVLLKIVKLAKEGRTISEIARELDRKESGIRRYAHDYGVTIRAKGMSGPSFNGRTAQRMQETLQSIKVMIEEGMSTAKIAEATGLNPATVRDYSKRCRDLFGTELPHFDRRRYCGKGAKTAKSLKTKE